MNHFLIKYILNPRLYLHHNFEYYLKYKALIYLFLNSKCLIIWEQVLDLQV